MAEGVPRSKIFFVGNVMIDTLLKHKSRACRLDLSRRWGLEPGGFATLTLHRPSNVDDPAAFRGILEALAEVAREIPIIFPIHPRTLKMLKQFGLGGFFTNADRPRGLWLTDPLGYLDLLHLNMNARMIITDSGGLQEESSVLGVPCITLRQNTERLITCEVGTNVIAGNARPDILRHCLAALRGESRRGCIPDKWDGHAAERIVEVLARIDRPAARSGTNCD